MSANPIATQSRPPGPNPAPVTNAEKARALIAMLEKKDQPGTVSADRLRDWASDLIRTVEGETKPAAEPTAPRRRRLFTKAPPKLSPVSPAAADRVTAESQPSRLTLTAPVPHTPAVAAQPARSTSPTTFTPAEVRKIMLATVNPETLSREHPAIIAMTLLGKPSMEQATALRALPGGQVRAVHKALRQLEFNAPSLSVPV